MKKPKQSNKDNLINVMKLSSRIKKGTYENIFVDCPYCRRECVFNRISDLETIMPITGQDLECEYCGRIFWVWCDRVRSSRYEWFLDDLPLLKKNKSYGLYILALCQACEMFMHQAIINRLIDTNPAYRDRDGHFCGNNKVGADAYNEIYQSFCDKPVKEITNGRLKGSTKYSRCTFDNLRNLFLYVFDDARKNELPSLKKLKEDKREQYFSLLEETKINQTRNDIVHKYAYRPTFSDVQGYEGLIDCLYWMGIYLDVKESLLNLNRKIDGNNST